LPPIATTGSDHAFFGSLGAMLLNQVITHALGHTTCGRFFRTLLLLVFVLFLPLASVVGFSAFALHEFSTELKYSRDFNQDWKAHYEVERGSLFDARSKASLAASGAVVNALLGVWIYRKLMKAIRGERDAPHPTSRRHRKRRSLE
jgi:hypothetical protein